MTLELMGAVGSPYTRKMLATLRYRHIPYRVFWGNGGGAPEGYPKPKVALLPTFYFPDGDDGALVAVTDSTPITRRLEREYAGRGVIPTDPALAFLNTLIEDYADEWLTKPMFHYRWHYKADYENAGPLLIYWGDKTAAPEEAMKMSAYFTKRQIDRLFVVGSNDVTAETIENSYKRLIAILDTLIQAGGYVLGRRPASADFALYGQLTQLAWVEPTSAAVLNAASPRLRAWIDRMDDLSGLNPTEADWFTGAEAAANLKPLLTEIGRVYAPFLRANAAAIMAGEKSFETEIDGRRWTQPAFPYQAKCLKWLRDDYASLTDDVRAATDSMLAGTGCEALFSQ